MPSGQAVLVDRAGCARLRLRSSYYSCFRMKVGEPAGTALPVLARPHGIAYPALPPVHCGGTLRGGGGRLLARGSNQRLHNERFLPKATRGSVLAPDVCGDSQGGPPAPHSCLAGWPTRRVAGGVTQ